MDALITVLAIATVLELVVAGFLNSMRWTEHDVR